MTDLQVTALRESSFLSGKVLLHAGDCLDVLPQLAPDSIDSCVCDPPYGLSFMGKAWDHGVPGIAYWRAIYRVLKPGAHLLAFGGTRTYHRMACAIEDAGFEVRDTIMWIYGSGFPKSLDISKAIDKAAGAKREHVATGDPVKRMIPGADQHKGGWEKNNGRVYVPGESAPATEAAAKWDGWGTALKPAQEPIVVAQKPLLFPQFCAIVLAYITDGLVSWLSSNANAAETDFSALQATLREAANSVLASARISALASIEPALSAVTASISIELESTHQPKTRVAIAQLLARQSSSAGLTPESRTASGVEVDISTRIMAMCTSVAMGDTSENIVSSWLSISADLLSATNKFTIETASRLTIALRTLNCLLRPNTSNDIGNLVPNCEPIVLARKPLSEKTVAANVLKWGTGALNVDGCRVEAPDGLSSGGVNQHEGTGWGFGDVRSQPHSSGRWPANLIHDGSDEVVGMFPDTGVSSGGKGDASQKTALAGHVYGEYSGATLGRNAGGLGDSGSAARFFYSAKADSDDRLGSKHPTVKKVDLMQYLCRLVTPPSGTVLDCFAGTGTTGEAAFREGFKAILIEREAEYCDDIRRRMALVLAGPDERARESIKARTKDKPVDHGPLFAEGGAG